MLPEPPLYIQAEGRVRKLLHFCAISVRCGTGLILLAYALCFYLALSDAPDTFWRVKNKKKSPIPPLPGSAQASP